MVKSKLPPRSGRSLEAFEPHPQKGAIKFVFFLKNQIRRKKLLTSSIDKSQEDSSCRLCIETNESTDHLVSGCSKLACKEYKRRHNNQIDIVHWELVK